MTQQGYLLSPALRVLKHIQAMALMKNGWMSVNDYDVRHDDYNEGQSNVS